MRVTIMFRNSYTGGDGWQYYPLRIEIGDKCPICGGQRGKPHNHHFCEDGEWFDVDKWENPCGHVDKYKDVYFEAQELKNKTTPA